MWYSETEAFIDANRDAIEADVRWHFEQPPAPMATVGDYGEWGAEVLARCDKPDELLKLLGRRVAKVDAEAQEAADVTAHVRAHLQHLLKEEDVAHPNPDQVVIRMEPLVLGEWVRELRGGSAASNAQYMRGAAIPCVTPMPRDSKGRSFFWRGPQAGPDAQPTYLLKYQAGMVPEVMMLLKTE
jgi:hypothetical protein